MTTILLEAPPLAEANGQVHEYEIDLPKGYEYVAGEKRELNVSTLSSYVAGNVYFSLKGHFRATRKGWVFPEGTTFRCFRDDPMRIRRADTAFIRIDRLTKEQTLTDGYCSVVPDMVVEVVSPNASFCEVFRKRIEWLATGAKLVWVVDPDNKLVVAYRSNVPPIEYREGDVLTADPVLPDFKVALTELFELPERETQEK